MPERRRRRWSEDDIAVLMKMAGKHSSTKIASALGRGVSGVAVKAHELDISLRTGRSQPSDSRPARMHLTD
jgi:hypothetical protein